MATDNLVLNGKSIDTLEEIVENFSPDDILREFRNGVLERWLYNQEYTGGSGSCHGAVCDLRFVCDGRVFTDK